MNTKDFVARLAAKGRTITVSDKISEKGSAAIEEERLVMARDFLGTLKGLGVVVTDREYGGNVGDGPGVLLYAAVSSNLDTEANLIACMRDVNDILTGDARDEIMANIEARKSAGKIVYSDADKYAKLRPLYQAEYDSAKGDSIEKRVANTVKALKALHAISGKAEVAAATVIKVLGL